jgi:N-acetylmuramoyl-L-alanine amidase
LKTRIARVAQLFDLSPKSAMASALLAAGLLVGVLSGASQTAVAQAVAPAATGQTGEPEAGSRDPAVAIVHAVRLTAGPRQTRLEFDIAGVIAPRAFVLADPDRAIIDLPNALFRLSDTGAVSKAGLIASYRYGAVQAGRSRLVIDLARPARIASARFESLTGEAGKLIIELAPTANRAEFLALMRQGILHGGAGPSAAGDQAPALRPSITGAADPGAMVIAIDPGHGGIDSGALGQSRIAEKEIALEFGKALARQLEASGRYRIVMTRSDDTFVPLGERVRIARAAGAKLLVSIHADTLNERYVQGATVYTLSDKASDTHAARLAAKENLSDAVAGHIAEREEDQVGDILADLTRRETRTFSHVFARSLVSYWQQAGRLNKNPLRSAGFTVLRAHDIPSILLELGYLSSKTDAADLARPEWRAKAASAVVGAIDSFFAGPASAAPAVANQPASTPKGGKPVDDPENAGAGGPKGVTATSHQR